MNLLIRADASIQMGTGHVMRCLALAQAWIAEGGKVTFLMCQGASKLEARLESEGIEIKHLLAIPGSMDDAQETAKTATVRGASWVVLDGYQFNGGYQRLLKDLGLCLLCLDDYGHAEHYYADLVLNQNISACEEIYSNRESYTKLLLGTKFSLLRQEFLSWRGWQRKSPTVAQKVLVTLGGADPDNVTLQVIQALQLIQIEGLEAIVVLGGSNPHYGQIQLATQASKINITLHRNVTDMSELMAWADMAISAGGSTNWELALMGLPSLIISLADNQTPNAIEMGAQGIVSYLGWHQHITSTEIIRAIETMAYDRQRRERMSQEGQKLVDGYYGRQIIINYLNSNSKERCLNILDK